MPRGYAPQKWDGHCHVKTLMHATAAHATQSEEVRFFFLTCWAVFRLTLTPAGKKEKEESATLGNTLGALMNGSSSEPNTKLLQHNKAYLQGACAVACLPAALVLTNDNLPSTA